MKKYVMLSLLLLFITGFLSVKAQEIVPEPKRNTIFIELLGNGGFYSLNYDRILKNKERWKLAGRAGFTYFNFFDSQNTQQFGVPLEASYLFGKGNHYLETGLGFTAVYETSEKFSDIIPKENSLFIILPARLGYRYQRKDGGFFFKAGYTPQFHKLYRFGKQYRPKHKGDFYPIWFGIGVGYSF